jgi:hypothetical protein
MPTPAPREDLRICRVAFENGQLRITLRNQQLFSVDLAEFPALAQASFEDRLGWMVVDDGLGLVWPTLGLGVGHRGGLINARRLMRDAQHGAWAAENGAGRVLCRPDS